MFFTILPPCRFCGKISSVNFEADKHVAVIHFEKPQAAKTALMLNGGTLDGSHLEVTSETVHPDHDEHDHSEHVDQSDKPRAGSAFLRPPWSVNTTQLIFRLACSV